MPSSAHIKQNPNSDHNTGLAVDLTHDPDNGVDCKDIYKRLQDDRRVKYLIFSGKIWNQVDGDVLYLSPTTPGRVTNIKPTGLTGHIVVIGYVEYAHANNGKIYVNRSI